MNVYPSQLSRSHRKRAVRGKVLALARMTKGETELGRQLYPEVEGVERPRTRGDCVGHVGPCPFVSCKHHLYLDIVRSGGIKFNFPDLEPWELEETCALDVADRGGKTLERVGDLMNMTRERLRQIQDKGLRRLRILAPRERFEDADKTTDFSEEEQW